MLGKDMEDRNNPARVMALLTLAKSEDKDAEAGASIGDCLDLEEITAIAEPARLAGLSWEQRHRMTRHLAACPECYRRWLAVARQISASSPRGWSFTWQWPRLSFKVFAYTGGAVAVALSLLLFLHLRQPEEETNFASSANMGLSMSAAKGEKLVAEKKPAEPADKSGDTLAEKRDGSIRIGAVEVRRSTDQLAVWYGDLREICRSSQFVPEEWTTLYARGADILEILPEEEGHDEEIDRLWLVLGQMEGLTATRRKTFCAWSEKELVKKLNGKGDNRKK
ncbi:MAG TPA: hypothetical protein DEB25_08400 [Desulfobulbaceae bacterium]|nr:hypothetical protein [Desulfobulbaceae bacterium]